MAPPGPNVAVARAELALLHQVLGLARQDSLPSELRDAVFVCIDCEAYESQQQCITEVGVAVLDTKDLCGVRPGERGEHWIAKMKYAHYRPVEYAMKVNRRFVKGAEDRFAFGDSTWINLQDAAKVLTRIFQCPERLPEATNFDTELADSQRNIIFVAHGLSNDDAYLKALGFEPRQANNLSRQIDSQKVAGGTKKNSIGLRRLLDKLGMRYHGLHNGGNDAAYTLQSVIVMAVKESQQPGLIFDQNNLPAIDLPGSVRAAGVSAVHVYGGTALEGLEKLSLNGYKPAKPTSFTKRKKNGFAKLKQDPLAKRANSTAALPNLGRHSVKRATPEGDVTDEQSQRKRHAR